MATDAEIAWAAGLFEGEGSITICGRRPRLQMQLTDRDVLGRFAMVVGAGEIYGPYTRGHHDGFKAEATLDVGVPRRGNRRGTRVDRPVAQ